MRLYLDHSKAGVDPFSPDNPLILTTGPISGTMWPTGGNGHTFVSKSPQTFGVGESKAHGSFGTEMKRAGYDAIIIKGKAEKPVYLWVDDDSIQLVDASSLMGKSPRRDRGRDKRGAGRLLHTRRRNRHSWRETLQNSLHNKRQDTSRWTNRPRRRHGFKEPQSHSHAWNKRRCRCKDGRVHGVRERVPRENERSGNTEVPCTGHA